TLAHLAYITPILWSPPLRWGGLGRGGRHTWLKCIMAQDDFDIDRLAAYLHMMPADVTKLAERGKLPGRRVGGQWRFSAAEIHHWLEDRIGLSDDEALVQMEGALDRASQSLGIEQISISKLLKLEAIEIPFAARTRGSVITRMTELAAQTHLLW